jgi:cyclopropane fatty-acyl-phospholipid synthase-like methyltransferase
MKQQPWFESWFDSPYYHLLYKNRDKQEAEHFISNLLDFLKLPPGCQVLDLACGKGRHSVLLSNHCLEVTGVDLSANSIASAKQLEHSKLHFEVRDMRQAFTQNKFSCIFNLFTSFGYFDNLIDNQNVVKAMHTMLAASGMLVIDFMNAERVLTTLVHEETKTVDSIHFQLLRSFTGTHIVKDIRFHAEGHDYHFIERVQALRLEDFKILLEAHGFKIIRTFGDFDLNTFDSKTSDRLILIARKS